jgi:RNA polymerase sigma-70 factor, ECF subfamily
MLEQAAAQSELTDTELLAKISAGETDFFGSLVRRYNRRLYRITRTIVQSDVEADDVTQEAFVRAFEHLGEFEGRAHFSTWLTRIAIRAALRRKKQQRREVPLDIAMQPTGGVEMSSGAQEKSVLRQELRHVLEAAIDALPEPYRLVFVMRHIEEMSTAETARCLEITEKTVKVRLVRARRVLRRQISTRLTHVEDAFPFLGARCDRITTSVLRRIAALQQSAQK